MFKKLLIFIHLFLIGNSTYSQENLDKKAFLSETILNDSVVSYNFISNYQIEEWKADQLAARFKYRYTEIIDISIESSTQIVNFSIYKKDKDLFLGKFVQHFKYIGYEIH